MNTNRRAHLVFSLLAIAAAARILVQVAAMPPYAGLDEIYHVARVAFVQNEGRSPDATELSVPVYIHESLALESGVLPDFVKAAPRWREMVRDGYQLPEQTRIPEGKRTTYLTPNYQAQQASLYYRFAAFVTELFGDGSRISELRSLRLFSAFLALIAVIATGWIGFTLAGLRGVAASCLLFLLPTWHTLMIRASNDAIAVSALSLALALSIRGSNRATVLEALAWSVALAAKLFTWPVLVALPILWWRQKPSRFRVAIVAVTCLVTIAATSLELRSRTGVPVGLAAFETPATEQPIEEQPIAYGEMVKITIASAIWMSGQHNNALTLKGMALYVIAPLAGFALLFFLAPPEGERRIWAVITLAILASFALAQALHASAHIRNARLLGESLPAAGKEGWYWLALAPLVIGMLVSPLFDRVRCGFLWLATVWLLVWDVLITEGALFRDYAGVTSASTPSLLFRWGPAPVLSLDLPAALSGLAVGPFTDFVLILRFLSIAGVVALVIVGCRARSLVPDDDGTP